MPLTRSSVSSAYCRRALRRHGPHAVRSGPAIPAARAPAQRGARGSARRPSWLLLAGLVLLYVARQEQRLADHKQQQQPGAADQLELDPGRFLEAVGDV